MAVIDPTNTARCYLDYTSMGISHTLMFRMGVGATSFLAQGKASAAGDIMRLRMQLTDSVTAARFAAAGSHFSLPIPFLPVAGTIASLDNSHIWAEDPESAFISFIGRGLSTGRRVRWELFTPCRTTTWPASNRYGPGASAPIDALRANWQTFVEEGISPEEQIVTVAGDVPTVYGYVNIAKNAYWTRKQR